MAHIEVEGRVFGRSAQQAYDVLCDFESYAASASPVREITVAEEDGRRVSRWEVNFHGGIMRWKQEDSFLLAQHAIRFRQVDGDMDAFAGEWRAVDAEGGCRVTFSADFDLGMPGMDEILNPVAQSALRENVEGIFAGLLGATDFSNGL